MSVSSHRGVRLLAAAAGVATLALLAHPAQRVDALLFDALLGWRAAQQPSDVQPYVLVEIDDPSVAAFGRFPWSRGRFADLLAVVQPARARAVAFDVLFSEPADSAGDARFATAIRAAGNVVLASAPELAQGVPPRGLQSVRTLLEPLPLLAAGAAGVGSIAVLEDDDGSLRRYPVTVLRDGGAYPSLVGLMAARGAPATPGRPEAAGATGTMLINFGALSPASILRIPFVDAVTLDSAGARELFGDRLVFVGTTFTGGVDYGPTPLSARTPIVFAQIYATHTLLSGRPLRELPGWMYALVTLLVAAVLASLASSLHPAQLLPVGAALAVALMAGAVFAFLWRDVLIGPTLPVLATGLVVSGHGLDQWWMSNTALRQRNRELAETLENLRNTRAAKEVLEAELNVAREIQVSMLPVPSASVLNRTEFALDATLLPARSVGGDFYDYFLVDEHHLCVCIGDVSDKGVPAALFMAVAKTILKSGALRYVSPGETLTIGNSELVRDNPASMFVSVWMGLLDLRTGTLRYANAGHNPPYVRRASGELVGLDAVHGPVMAAVEGAAYGETSLTLGAGDVLILYTDGVTEARGTHGALYDYEGLEAALRSANAGTAKAMVDHIAAEVSRFQDTEPQADDITILVLRYAGQAGAAAGAHGP